jgi:predicted permease
MSAVTLVALPIFALVATGWAARRFALLEAPSVAGLNAFVFHAALPALLCVKTAEAPIREAFDWRLLAAYHAAGFAIFALAALAARLVFRRRVGAMGLAGLGATFGNHGYIGLPIVLTAFGPAAVLPAVMVMATDAMVTVSVAVAMLELGREGGGRWGAAARTVGLGLARNPILGSTLAGAALSLAGLPLPGPVAAFGNLLGAAALPCALFALGASLVGRRPQTGLDEITLLVGLKLVIHPLAVWALAAHVLVLDRLWTKVAMVEAALPAAATVFILAQRYDVYVEQSAGTVLVSTAVSVLTVSALLALMG